MGDLLQLLLRVLTQMRSSDEWCSYAFEGDAIWWNCLMTLVD